MRRQFFWLMTAAIFAFACHIAYVLFVPSRALNAGIDAALGAAEVNSFTILDPQAQMRLLPFAASGHLVGVCKFNVAKGPVKLAATLPEGFWSLAVYTIRGQQVYAINDTQADTNTFSVELSRAGSFFTQLIDGNENQIDILGDDIGWRIAVNEDQGLAVIWLTLADPLLRSEAEAVMKKSKCARADKPT
jgi:uncharacterized membrane protein